MYEVDMKCYLLLAKFTFRIGRELIRNQNEEDVKSQALGFFKVNEEYALLV